MALEPEMPAATNFATATPRLPAKAASTTRVEPLAIFRPTVVGSCIPSRLLVHATFTSTDQYTSARRGARSRDEAHVPGRLRFRNSTHAHDLSDAPTEHRSQHVGLKRLSC